MRTQNVSEYMLVLALCLIVRSNGDSVVKAVYSHSVDSVQLSDVSEVPLFLVFLVDEHISPLKL